MPATQTHKVDATVGVDMPDVREYECRENAALDESLVESIEAAKAAGNDYLADLLASELGSHYYETR